MSAVVFAGCDTGTFFPFVLSGIICSKWDWSVVFYAFGAVGLLIFPLWMFFVSDSPHDHPSISTEEKLYIAEGQHTADTGQVRVPWKRILCSPPVWAISIASFAHNWVTYLTLTDLPLYFEDVLNMNISENGFFTALPNLVALFTQITGGLMADQMIKNGYQVRTTRVLVTVCGFFPAALCLIAVGFVGCGKQWLPILLCVATVAMANFSTGGGYFVNRLDLSSRFAGVLYSINAIVSHSAGVFAPLVTGLVTEQHPTRYYYRIVFMIAAAVCLIGTVTYSLFASGEEQEWSLKDMSEVEDCEVIIESCEEIKHLIPK